MAKVNGVDAQPPAATPLAATPIAHVDHDDDVTQHIAESRLAVALQLAADTSPASQEAARLAFESVLAISQDPAIRKVAHDALEGKAASAGTAGAPLATSSVPAALDGYVLFRAAPKRRAEPDEWRRVYAVLSHAAINLSAKASKPKPVGDARGTLSLYASGDEYDVHMPPQRAVGIVQARVVPDPEWNYTLHVQPPGEKAAAWELRFTSTSERDRWAVALHALQVKHLDRLAGARSNSVAFPATFSRHF